jgi:uncharacterized protein (DUF1015 family)
MVSPPPAGRLALHEHSVRRLIHGDATGERSSEPAFFASAARLLAAWKESGIVVRDPRPALYALTERFEGGVRRSLACLARIDGPGGPVLPHEDIGGSSVDVLRAQRAATEAQFSSILVAVPDGAGELARFLAEPRPVAWSARDGDGLATDVAREENPDRISALLYALAGETAVLLDGHHRWAAAAGAARAGAPTGRESPGQYALVAVVPVGDPGLRCGPTHRAVHSLGAARRQFEAGLAAWHVEALAPEGWAEWQAAGGVRLVLVDRSGFRGARLRNPGELRLPEALREVDAAVLFEALLPSAAAGEPSGGRYTHNRGVGGTLIEDALAGRVELAILLRPVAPAAVLAVAEAGLLMPPKSTNFQPKPSKGVVMASLSSF